jgi:hypothetical protein
MLDITVHYTPSGKHNQDGDGVKKISVETEVGKRIKGKTNSTNKNILTMNKKPTRCTIVLKSLKLYCILIPNDTR